MNAISSLVSVLGSYTSDHRLKSNTKAFIVCNGRYVTDCYYCNYYYHHLFLFGNNLLLKYIFYIFLSNMGWSQIIAPSPCLLLIYKHYFIQNM